MSLRCDLNCQIDRKTLEMCSMVTDGVAPVPTPYVCTYCSVFSGCKNASPVRAISLNPAKTYKFLSTVHLPK